MRGFITSASVAAILTSANAIPLQKRATFTLEQVAVNKTSNFTPAQALLNTYGKYGKADAAPDHVKDAAAAGATGSATTTPQSNDESYLTPVTVGSDTLNLDFDTGSSDLWVFSNLQSSSQTSGHSIYHTSSSKLKSGYSWSISYGDGSGASGKVYADKVVVGGVTATSQAVEAATSISTQFSQDVNNDGLLGLAFSSINTVKPKSQTTFFDTVKSSLEQPLFAATLKKGKPGSYDFGYVDDSKYTGSLTTVSVDSSQGFWGFTADDIGTSIADTGTTLLLLPDSNVQSYYSGVSGASLDSSQGGYTFPCSSELPDFTVGISGSTFTVPGSYINYAPIDESGSTCFGGIQGNDGLGLSIFGDIFLKAHYVVFDSAGPSLHIAPQAGV